MNLSEILLHIKELVEKGLNDVTPEYHKAWDSMYHRSLVADAEELKSAIKLIESDSSISHSFKNPDFISELLEERLNVIA